MTYPVTQLPPLSELQECAHTVSLPLHHRFRGVSHREVMLFDAPRRWSEFAPFLEYGAAESAAWLRAAIAFGWQELPGIVRKRVPVNATLPAVAAADVPRVLARFPGAATVKVKVAERGQTLQDDLARVAAARRVLGEHAQVRVDANGAWSPQEALVALRELSVFELEYVEQPCATVPELSVLRGLLRSAGVKVRVAADESIRKVSDPFAVVAAGAADLLVLKAAPLGGVDAALRIAERAGLPVVVSSALDSSVGIGMGAHLAASLPEHLFGGACGLGTAALLAADVCEPPLQACGGELRVASPRVDRALLQENRCSPEREKWWRERLAAVYTKLVQQIES